MHVHANQFDPRIALYAQIASAKTEAQREAERTRRKLLYAASTLAGECDDCVVRLSGDGGNKEHGDKQGGESQDGQKQDERVGVGSGEDVFSDWA